MNSDGSFEDTKETAQNHPLLVTQRSNFQWVASLKAAPLAAGWQDHLTRYLLASATVSLSFEGQEPLPLIEVKKLDDPLDLYQIITHRQAVEVQIAYRALSQPFMDAPYDCHLLLKTEVGGRFVTLPSPKPPSQAEWKQALKKLWFQLLLTEDALFMSDAPHDSRQQEPLYTFKLHPELGWEAAKGVTSERIFGAWQRELRLTVDPADPHMVRAWLIWNDGQSPGSPAVDQEALEQTEPPSGQEQQTTGPQAPIAARQAESAPMPVLAGPLPSHQRWRGFSRVRLAALVAAIVLLLVIGGVVVGAARGTPGSDNALVILKPSPTAGQTPSDVPSSVPSPTLVVTTEPTVPPDPGSTPHPGPTPTSRPKPTPTPTHTPTSTPTHTPTPTPPPTPTPTPTDTPTPPPTPTPTPTDTPPPQDTPTP